MANLFIPASVIMGCISIMLEYDAGMIRLRPLLLIAALSLFIPHAHGQLPVEPDQLLRELETLRDEREQRMTGVRDNAIRALSDAAANGASAVDFYQQTIRELDFAGQDRESTKYREWQEKNTDRLRDKTFQRAVQLHLNYLLLTISRANGAELDVLLTPLVAHATELQEDSHKALRNHKDMLAEELAKSVFVRRYGLQAWFNGLQDWEMNPGNANGIFEKNILPAMRKAGDARVLNYWDQRIQRESANSLLGGAFAQQRFKDETLPTLQMRRAEELFHIDRASEGVSAMFEIIRDNPQHSSFNAWADQLKQRVEAMRAAPAPDPVATEVQIITPPAVLPE